LSRADSGGFAEDGHGAAIGPVIVFVSELGDVAGSEQGFLVSGGWDRVWSGRWGWWSARRGIAGGRLVDELSDMGERGVPWLDDGVPEFGGEFCRVIASLGLVGHAWS
jgi:hypothetical protein